MPPPPKPPAARMPPPPTRGPPPPEGRLAIRCGAGWLRAIGRFAPDDGRFPATGRGRFEGRAPAFGRLAPDGGRFPATGRFEGRVPAFGRLAPVDGRPPATGRFEGTVPAFGRLATPPPGRSTCWPPLPRKSGRGRVPAPMLVSPKRCCTFTLLYRKPRRCAG